MPQRPASQPERDRAVEHLVEECLRRGETDDDSGIQAVCAERPELESDVRAAVKALQALGLDASTDNGDDAHLGPYRLVRQLGGGGMGIVYLAERMSDAASFAVKVIRPDFALFDKARQRFSREIDAVRRLDHPGIVPILDVNEDRDVPYLVMPYIHGANLADVLKHLPSRDPRSLTADDLLQTVARRIGRPAAPSADSTSAPAAPWSEACVDVARQLAEAVAHAHSHGVLHRDLKPSNIMITPDGRALLLDFGLAHADGATPLTRTGSLLGSEPYVAPEQIDGTASNEPRADVYGMGVILYEMLTLHSPFAAPTPRQTLQLVRRGDAPPVRTLNDRVTRDVETVCMKAFDVAPRRRYQLASGMADDLRCVQEGRAIRGRRVPPWARSWRTVRAHPAISILSAVALLIVAGSLAFGIQMRALQIQAGRAHDEQFRATGRLSFLSSLTRNMFAHLDPDERFAQIGRLSTHIDAETMSASTLAAHRATIGSILTTLHFFDEARATLLESIAGFEVLGEDSRVALAGSLVLLANNSIEAGQASAARKPLARAWEILQKETPDDLGRLSAVLHARARAMLGSGRLDEGLALAEEALAMRRAWYGEARLPVIETLAVRAKLHARRGEARQALATLDEADALARQISDDPGHPAALAALAARGMLHRRMEDHRETVEVLEKLLAVQLEVSGPLSLQVAETRTDLAYSLQCLGLQEEALAQYETVRSTIDQKHNLWHRCEINSASLMASLGRTAEAQARLQGLLDRGNTSRQVVQYMMARADHQAGHLDAAEQAYRAYEELARSSRPRSDCRRAYGLVNRGLIARDSGQPEIARALFTEARALFDGGVDSLRGLYQDGQLDLLDLELDRARFLVAIEDWNAAVPELTHGLEVLELLHGEDHWSVAAVRAELGLALAMQGQTTEGEELLTSAYTRLDDYFGAEHRQTQWVARALARIHGAAGHVDEEALWLGRGGEPGPAEFITVNS